MTSTAVAPATDSAETAPTTSATPFNNALFAATHNSYSGGDRGTITQQLDSGVRFIELDLNDNDYSKVRDFQIGHGSPGRQVDHSPGNPPDNLFRSWLGLIANWSRSNPGHAPITLGLDLKNNLSSKDSAADGNLSALNEKVSEGLGELLYTSATLGTDPWPAVGDLNGKIVVVLSGNQDSRKAYLSDQGANPSVALNSSGWVAEVHKSQSFNTLWTWTGHLEADGNVTWLGHAKLDSGKQPAVAINDAGVVVEVHKSENFDQLYYHVGQLQPDGSITWGDSHKFASGSQPSIAFASPTGLDVVEIHVNGGNQRITGTVDPANRTIRWGSAQPTSQSRFTTNRAQSAGREVFVTTGVDSAGTADTLLYSTFNNGTPQVSGGRIRYAQLLFVEFQKGNSSTLEAENLWFYAASASSGNLSWAGEWRRRGKSVRLWAFTESSIQVQPPVNYPATDTPYADWYVDYTAAIGTIS